MRDSSNARYLPVNKRLARLLPARKRKFNYSFTAC
jgi:hypothetical protein